MEVGAGHAPLRQCGHQAFHHAGRAAEVKLVQAGRQRPLEQGQVHVAGVLVIRPLQVLGQRPAVDHVQTEWGMRFCHVFQHCFVGLFGTVAYAVIQVHRALGLVFGAPAQHGHHGRDADAAAYEYDRRGRCRVQVEMARRSPHAHGAAGGQGVMEIARPDTGRLPGCGGPFDGDPAAPRRPPAPGKTSTGFGRRLQSCGAQPGMCASQPMRPRWQGFARWPWTRLPRRLRCAAAGPAQNPRP